MTDLEMGSTPLPESAIEPVDVAVVSDLSQYSGDSLEDKVESFFQQHPVAIISKTWCPFSNDVKDLLVNQIGVEVHTIEVNAHPEGSSIFK